MPGHARKPKSAIWRKLTLSNWLVAIVPMIAIFIVVSIIFMQTMAENKTRQAQVTLDNACGEADLWVSQANEVLSMLCLDINTQNAISSFPRATLKQQLNTRDFFRNRLVGMYTSDMEVANVSLYLLETGYTFSQDYRDRALSEAYRNAPWFQRMCAGDTASERGWGRSITGEGDVFWFARSIHSMRSGKLLGLGYVELPVSRLVRIFTPLVLDGESAVLMEDRLSLGNPNGYAGRYSVYAPIPALGVSLEYRMSNARLLSAYALSVVCFMAGLGVLMLMIYGIDKHIADSFARRILRQVEATRSIAAGNLDIDIQDPTGDELGELSMSLNRMARDMKRLINEKYIAEISRQQASLHALQSQINPHFIFNTLERISMLALIHDQWEIVNIAQSFSSMMRYAIAPGGLVPLEEELDSVGQYISIQRSRFEEPIQVSYSLPQKATLSLPRLTLQPLVENAFRHGFEKGMETPMKISVCVEKEDGGVRIVISNNGAAISPKRIAEIQALLLRPTQEGAPLDCFALRNIYQRLRLIFGEEAKLEILSGDGKPTRTVLWLPKKQEEGKDVSDFAL